MANADVLTDLIRYAIQVIGRIAIPVENVKELLGDGAKQANAFNLADGTLSQGEIAKKAKLDQGNFSRTANRWVREGIAFWVGQGTEKRLCHIYPVPDKEKRAKSVRRRWSGRKRTGKR